jgi:uncharacterized protein YbgA (DUF1722 family)/uncharacterized protein YbbK (DUF523 family)
MQHHPSTPTALTIHIGISSCLLGEEVRYNGGHSNSKLCSDVFSKYFKYRRFCPEVAAGFSIPRPTMRLIGDPNKPQLRFSNNPDEDLTNQLTSGFERQLENFDELDGYILMKNSPSCGMERIKIYQENGHPHMQRGRGLFAEALMSKYPLLPVEEDGRLNDAPLRENFVMRVFAHANFRHEVVEQPSYHNLLQFHSSYKYMLMAHSQHDYRELGQLLAVSSKLPLDELIPRYKASFMQAISEPARRGNHCNTMQHILGYLKKTVSNEDRRGVQDVISQYHREEVNLATPMALLNHYIQLTGSDYIRAQRYFEPYPATLGLRNQV